MDENDLENMQLVVGRIRTNERDIENLQLVVEEQERTIRDLQQRVCTLEMAIDRANKTINELVEEKFGRVWKAIRRLEAKELER